MLTPCKGSCQIDWSTGDCRSCLRTRAEIAGWLTLTDQERARITLDLRRRETPLGTDYRVVPVTGQGWSRHGELLESPAPFPFRAVRLDDGSLNGLGAQPGHALDAFWIVLTPAHDEGEYWLRAYSREPGSPPPSGEIAG